MLVGAAGLVRKGKVFSLGLSLKEPIQSGLFGGRWNPIHTMLATGTDAASGTQDEPYPYLRYADDAINMPCQASTQWDALCHVFLDDKMYNGYDARLVDVRGAKKLGIEHVRDKMVGRGVLLDVARFKSVPSLDDGYAVTIADLDKTCGPKLAQCTWGTRKIVRIQHPISHGVPLLAPLLDMPTVQLPGDHDMPRVQEGDFGASERFAVSPGHEDQGYFHMPGGQSGHPLSPYYRVGFLEWARGEPLPFLPGKAEHSLTLQ